MRLFGFEISRSKAQSQQPTQPPSPGWIGSWWWPTIREPFTGAWQKNMELRAENLLTYFAVYSCVTLISTDIAKLCLRLMQEDSNEIWQETDVAAFSPVLRKPNHYQSRQSFIEQWIVSKLLHGNTYVLKERDARNVVIGLYVLDPLRTRPMVAPDTSVFYELSGDNLAGIPTSVTVPASEIIHDVMVPLYHPLCGVSPLIAAAIPVMQGLSIQTTSSKFFANGSRPGGILTSPHIIDQTTAERLSREWVNNFTGDNAGKVAVLGDGLKYESMSVPAEEAQLIDQLKFTAENVCSVFHVPPYMIGVQQPPSYNNVESLVQVYYGQCLQTLIDRIETLLDDGLALPPQYRTEFDLDDLLRMDTATLIKAAADGVKAGIYSPNEARYKFNLPPVKGGEVPSCPATELAARCARRTSTAAGTGRGCAAATCRRRRGCCRCCRYRRPAKRADQCTAPLCNCPCAQLTSRQRPRSRSRSAGSSSNAGKSGRCTLPRSKPRRAQRSPS